MTHCTTIMFSALLVAVVEILGGNLRISWLQNCWRCTVLTPGWGKRRALHFDLKSCQPTTWEVDRQTTFHLQILILNPSKLPKAADWMLTAMSAQSGTGIHNLRTLSCTSTPCGTRVILGHSKPPSPPGQNQAGLD